MESAHSLILNEEAFKKIEEHKKPVYVFEWLRNLDKLLVVAQKVIYFVSIKSSLNLDKIQCNRCGIVKIIVFFWTKQADVKACQKKLVEQLTTQIQGSPGPPTRKLLASCLSTLFSVGDTFLLFDTVNKCNDILKNKDDSPSFLPTKL